MTPSARARLLLTAAGVAAGVTGRILLDLPAAVEWHRATLFPLVCAALQPVFGASTSSIGEVVAMIVIAVAILALVRAPRRASAPLAAFAGLLVFAFYASWGLAYQYPALSNRLSPAPEAADRADAAKNLTRMAERSARLVALLTPETASAVPDAELLARINLGVEGGYAQLPAPLDAANLRAVRFGPTKLSRVSLALTHLNISGYYFPWTGEAHINEAMPRSEWARVAAHERAHQRGFARENEATVMGVLACLASGDPEVRYSGALGLFVSFDRDVARIGAEARKALWDLLPARAADDLRAESAFWKAHEGAPARVSEKVNDTYLKAQGVTTGVASYSETTRLFLQAMETEGIAATSHEAASAFEWEAARPRR